ncbi:MAG: PEP/pyruvate-binding domain-containing protein [Desulfocapsaceae bacterium]|nr:PEP/pyruvate-binding domain-containing protein [Desulfocapsaceae bacterium]
MMVKLADRLASLFMKVIPWRGTRSAISFNDLFVRFHQILEENNRAMELIAEMEDKLGGQYVFDRKFLEDTVSAIERVVLRSAYNFNFIANNKELEIYKVIESLARHLRLELAGKLVIPSGQNVLALEDIQEVMDEAVGNKVYNLFRISSLPQVSVPPSFVVTIGGFRKYLAFNNLFEKIDGLMEGCKNGQSVESASHSIRLLILNGDIPSDLRQEILKAAEKICPKNPESSFYSVRSSSVGEDGMMSFAGLHDSFLNVPFRELLSSYKKVLAGMYNPESLEYRIQRQVPFSDMAMAVLYQQMVPSGVAGVAYTLDPNLPDEQVCMLGANWGLGTVVVEGGAADMFRVSRKPPYAIIESRISEKKWMVVPFGGAEEATHVESERVNESCLTPSQAASIVETALMIERFFKRPMDIEWSLDTEGQLRILQARPLGLSRGGQARSPELKALLRERTALMRDLGVIAYRGVGSGPVWIVDDNVSLEQFPSGAVLVARYGIPLLARAIPRASAVITDVGSPTGHMATVAREFRIPTIVDTGSATDVLKNGQEVTVDAERNIIYEGRINELLHHQLLERPLFETLYEFQILRRLLRRIAPLTLIDPDDPNFTARGCQTFHDVIRFIHEKSVQTLLQIAEKPSSLLVHGGKRLKANLPLNLILIDIGGGLDETGGKGGWVVPEQITSQPMKALWAGMGSPDVWRTDPIVADFKGLMSGVTRTQTAAVAGQVLAGLNVAVLGEDYMNLTLRVGYHFTVVDARLGAEREKNSIFFRFVGGATDISRRSRRAALLMSIMEKIGFKVEGSGDLVIARVANSGGDRMKEYLYLIGRLIGFVRQLDILMTDDTTIDLYFEQFMKANNIKTTSDHKINRSDSDDK